jgi:hypothetical protein
MDEVLVQSLHADNDEEEGELQFKEREKLTWGIYQSSRGIKNSSRKLTKAIEIQA